MKSIPQLASLIVGATVIAASSLASISPLFAQTTDLTMSRDKYIESQLNMMEQLKDVQSEISDTTSKMMQEKMTPEEYSQYKKENEQAKKDIDQEAASCLGVSVDEMSELSEKVGADFQIEVIKTCSASLPETIDLSNSDWTVNPEFAEYKACAEDLVAKETGISAKKLQECSEAVGDS